MRLAILFGVVLTAWTFRASAADPVADLNDGLLLRFNFGDAADGIVKDATGNGHDGRVLGPKRARGRSGLKRTALSFDGIDDFIRVPMSIGPSVLEKITIAFWVKPTGDAFREVLVSNNNAEEAPWCRTLAISKSRSSEDRFFVAWYEDRSLNDATRIGLEDWYFVAASYDHESWEVSLFVNGRHKTAAGIVAEGLPHFFIGSSHEGGRPFKGLIEDFRVYGRVLTFAELDALFTDTSR